MALYAEAPRPAKTTVWRGVGGGRGERPGGEGLEVTSARLGGSGGEGGREERPGGELTTTGAGGGWGGGGGQTGTGAARSKKFDDLAWVR